MTYLICTGVLVLLYFALALNVSRMRGATKTGIGSGDDPSGPLNKAVRAHGNAAEYVPLALILIGTLEIAGAGRPLLHGLGATLTAARLLHAQGISSTLGTSPGRVVGTLLTWLVYLVGAGACLYYATIA